MPRGIPNHKKLNNQSQEVVNKNFLEEYPDTLPVENQIYMTTEMPKEERVVFVNNRDPGCALYFHYSSKTHPLKQYTLMHGLEYDLPVEVIKHLEGQNDYDRYSCHSRLYSSRTNYEGNPENYVSGYKSYFQCRSVRK